MFQMVAVIVSIFPEITSLPSSKAKRRSAVSPEVGAFCARTQLPVPPALASSTQQLPPSLLWSSFSTVFFSAPRWKSSLPLPDCQALYQICVTYSCLLRNELNQVKCHLRIAPQSLFTYTASFISTRDSSWLLELSRFKKKY